ncbi:MAG: hypothetical protein GY757_61160, partial [bacterium]|nr:hypothetical protein [bacterium]
MYRYYPELEAVQSSLPHQKDEVFDILLIGGSVMHPEWGHIQRHLERKFDRVRFHNIAQSSHSSLDSLTKLTLLKPFHYDLMIFYQGINEVRMNNIPEKYFREDYSHYLWHKEIQNFLNHGEINITVLPYMINSLYLHFKKLLGFEKYIESDHPNPEWLDYGRNLKTPQIYEKHIREIVSLAGSRNIPLLLVSFSVYLPPNYSKESFYAGNLDYNLGIYYKFPVELWGIPRNVLDGVEAHNLIL